MTRSADHEHKRTALLRQALESRILLLDGADAISIQHKA